MITALPDAIRDDFGDETEKFMVSKALEFNPHVLGQLGHRVTALLDPDGTLSDEDHHNKRRGLTITRHADGSGWISGYLTPILLAALQAVLDSLAAPNPEYAEPNPPSAPADNASDGRQRPWCWPRFRGRQRHRPRPGRRRPTRR